MLRRDLREALLLVLFTAFMAEYLTNVTIAVVALGAFLVFIRKRPGKLVRNALALVALASYWFTYGKVIDPEVGLNFLTTVIVLKLLEKDSERDQYMIFFGLLLVISAGSLFERTLSYVLFFGASFLVLIRDFYVAQKRSAGVRDLGALFLWILPLTFGLFLFIPRVMNPIPFRARAMGQGEIGYTTGVNFSSLEGLSANDAPAFQALVERPLSQEALYWRGNTVTDSDGWNWMAGTHDRSIEEGPTQALSGGTVQQIRLYTKEDFFFGLDNPARFQHRETVVIPGAQRTALQVRRRWLQRYEVVSFPQGGFENTEDLAPYLRLPLNKRDRQWIQENFRGTNLAEVQTELRSYFLKQGFVYTLRPGMVSKFSDFMREKRQGFCAHYASAVALILRAKKIPARLVSGFMGGAYNPFGNFYLVSQNDAHVWVEALDQGKWVRQDPTEWIAPDRVRLGGEAFMAATAGGVLGELMRIPALSFIQDLRLWFGQWDFRFYQWLEQVDYHGQEAFLSRLKFKREWFYTLAPLLLLVFTFFYLWQLRRSRRKQGRRPLDEAWALFRKKLRARGVDVPFQNVEETRDLLASLPHPQRSEILALWQDLVRVTFATEEDAEAIIRRVKRL